MDQNEIAMRAIECVQQLAKGRAITPQPQPEPENRSALKAELEQARYELKNAQELIVSQQRCIDAKNEEIKRYGGDKNMIETTSNILMQTARALIPFVSRNAFARSAFDNICELDRVSGKYYVDATALKSELKDYVETPDISPDLIIESAQALVPFASMYGHRRAAIKGDYKPSKGDYARAALSLDKLLGCRLIGPQDRAERYAWYASFRVTQKTDAKRVRKVSHAKNNKA